MKNYKTIGIIFLIIVLLVTIVQLSSETPLDWSKNFSVAEKSPFGLYVLDKESDFLFNKKIKKLNQSPYSFYDKNKKIKPHNILIIEKEIDEFSWDKILAQVSEGSDAMVLAESFPQKLKDTLELEHTDFNYSDNSIIYFTDWKLSKDSIIVDRGQSYGIFSKVNFKKTDILGDEYYVKENDQSLSSAANFIKIKFGKGSFYLHAEPLVFTNYYLLKKENQNYVQDVFSLLPERETLWFQNVYSESSQSPLRFILANPALKYAFLILLFSVLFFVLFNAKRRQRVIPIIEPLKNKSAEFIRTIGNLYMQEGDFHEMMAKKAQYFLHRVRTELLIDTHVLDEEFEKKLHLKTGKSLEKIKEAVLLIKKAQNPYAQVINEDLVKLNKILNEILK